MKLRDLIALMPDDTIILVRHIYPDGRYRGESFQGEAGIAVPETNDRYLDAEVMNVYPEYYEGWGKTGITILVATH